jgi:hypothetical protein
MKNLKQEVDPMKLYQIVEVMVESLKNPIIKVDMNYFGTVYDQVCYGCAATNAICKIADTKYDFENISRGELRSKFLKVDYDYLCFFETAIDNLRVGNIIAFYSNICKAKEITVEENTYRFLADIYLNIHLKKLTNDYLEKDLDGYVFLAEVLKKMNY